MKAVAKLFPVALAISLFSCFQPLFAEEQPSVETKLTKSGAVFTRDTSEPRLGEAWRDHWGIIWGDLVKAENGSPRPMSYQEATNYCQSIGARLPTIYEFQSLRRDLGGDSEYYADPDVQFFHGPPGYEPQILPNLTKPGTASGYYYWTYNRARNNFPVAYEYFYEYESSDGAFGSSDKMSKIMVRCCKYAPR